MRIVRLENWAQMSIKLKTGSDDTLDKGGVRKWKWRRKEGRAWGEANADAGKLFGAFIAIFE
jgi:hypothetical protein